MRIYDRDLTGSAATESGRPQETQRADRESASSTGSSHKSGDRVELSSGFASVSRALASQQADRAARVQALATQYQSGNYQPNSLATSHGMVSEALSGAR